MQPYSKTLRIRFFKSPQISQVEVKTRHPPRTSSNGRISMSQIRCRNTPLRLISLDYQSTHAHIAPLPNLSHQRNIEKAVNLPIYKIRQLLTQRFIDPIGQVLLQRQQLSALCRVETLVIELGVLFLFRRGPGHIGPIEHGDRGGSPAASITGVLRRRESIGVRHPEEGKDDWSRWPAPAPHFLSSTILSTRFSLYLLPSLP